jgi:phage/plasmid-like protein (TIGR03299 family)
MSEFTLEKLNDGHILTGDGIKPWWFKAEFQPAESTIYPGPIPVADVLRRVFYWRVTGLDVVTLVPLTATELAERGNAPAPFKDSKGRPCRIVTDTSRIAVARDDDYRHFHVAAAGFPADDRSNFSTWFLDGPRKIMGDALHVTSAGTLGNGETGFVTLGTGENVVTDDGFAVRPYLLAAAGLNGTLANIVKPAYGVSVCDNTLTANLADGLASFKVKHTKKMSAGDSDDIVKRQAEFLGLMEMMATAARETFGRLAAVKINSRAWNLLLDAVIPVPEKSGRGATMANNRRDVVTSLYRHDPRCEPWTGTGLGALQAFNTYDQHYRQVNAASGTNRFDRNMLAALKGEVDQHDTNVVRAIHAATDASLLYGMVHDREVVFA